MSTSSPARTSAEFIALMALTFSLIAMSIDGMLPALGDIAADLSVRDPNDRQLVLAAFFAGLSVGQFIYGPISDSTGRKPAMYAGIGCFIVGGLICAFATDFPMMLAGRALQGFGAAGPRIVGTAMVRDLYAGSPMARIMSFVMAVLILVPVLAPSIGQLILLIADWRAIFYGLAVAGMIDFLWLARRRPETLAPSDRVPLSIGRILRSAREAITNRVTLGYSVATGFVFGAVISYLGTAQQIFQEQYGTGKMFSVYFGLLAAGIGVASVINGRLVVRFGMRNLSKWALRSVCILAAAFLLTTILLHGHPPLWLFMGFMTALFFFNGMLFSNYNALAMEPMGHIAGVAAAIIASASTLVAVSTGTSIGRLYDGSVTPLFAGFAGLALAAFLVTEWAESGRGKRLTNPN
ncbi:multidrug effflux MFS transporter [Taklimakanibacter deserti]|uniref:multidrug effflux MFS transporter n=1 Tax=Taklimakanibacter deserti TaxID=2267839 RepID=UPI000E6574F2